ncbi:MAG TPA: Gfo/Idh/MocA family oxidoreductase [Bacteroidales bacterium]|nr:Gfo/Idh/MocA family oxidoreductase [Bacteroidales bacterium]HQQ13609.1 Gfo/Idh/MocA family oxidoreductase [Bacteroidales bacterium]
MTKPAHTFALIGAAGFIAPRHMKAIKETGNNLVAALDPFDSVGIIDSFFPEAHFFTEPERFDRHLDKLRRTITSKVDYVSICSPNYLHDAHIRMALRNGANAICEKPLVLNPWNLDALADIEKESGKRIFTILQLRHHPAIVALKNKIAQSDDAAKRYNIQLEYITSRGNWYFRSWKGNVEKSGGIATNIGVHFFDMLTWIFGAAKENILTQYQPDRASGKLVLERADVNWFLSINAETLPNEVKQQNKRTYRTLTVDGEEIEFSDGFTDLHTESYRHILAGNGFGLEDARASVQIVHEIRKQSL